MTVKSKLASAAVLAALGFTVPVSAAPIEQLNCVEDAMDPLAFDRLADFTIDYFMARLMEDPKAQDERPPPEAFDFEDVVFTCGENLDWTVTEIDAAFDATTSMRIKSQLIPRLTAMGIDLVALDAFIEKYPDPNKNIGPDVSKHLDSVPGLDRNDQVNFNLVILYWSFSALNTYSTQDFVERTSSRDWAPPHISPLP